jgi:CRISPR-associated exonuclease Cas4
MGFAVAILVGLGFLFLWLARRSRARTGLPAGQVAYADTDGKQRPERTLFSPSLGLTGKPDYIIDAGHDIVPVEVKSRSAPRRPYASHLLQLAAYCRLTEEAYGHRPPYGLIKYADHSFSVDYDPELEERLLRTLHHMRKHLASGEAPRNHDDRYRCSACGHRDHCLQRLS